MSIPSPPLYPDELVTSGLIRCCRRYGLSVKCLRQQVLDAPFFQARLLSVSAIPQLARFFRLPLESLVWRHTSIPYCTAYLEPAAFERALRYVRSAAGTGLGAFVQNATTGRGVWRFCAGCVSDDLHQFGESYWRRMHNLPGVVICPVHGTYLRGTDTPIRMSSGVPLHLPSDHGAKSARVLGVGKPSAALAEIARISNAVLQSTPLDRPGLISPADYRSFAYQAGLLPVGSQVSSHRLNLLLRQLFGRTYLDRWDVSPDSKQGGWPILMLRDGTGVPFVPFKHILLGIALCSRHGERAALLEHRSSGPSARESKSLDEATSQAVALTVRRMQVAGASCVTTQQLLREAGCWQTYRHRGADLPRLRTVVLKFRTSHLSIKPLGPGKQLYRTRPEELTG